MAFFCVTCFLMPWLGNDYPHGATFVQRAVPCLFWGEVWVGDLSLVYRPHSNGKGVSEKLEMSFDKNNRVHSKLTVGLTEAGFTTVFSSLQNVCRATHTSFLFSSHTRTLQLLLLSLVNWENINVFLQHTPVRVSQTWIYILQTPWTGWSVSFRSSCVISMYEHMLS